MDFVPWRLIMQVVYPSGHRPVKKEKLEPPKPDLSVLPSHYRPSEPSRFGFTPLVGNLPNHEYKYYMGHAEKQHNWCTCRWCAQEISVYGIATHRSSSNCSHMIDVTIESLAQDNLCVICQTHTLMKKWGVPLCHKSSCEREWQYGPWSALWRDQVAYITTLPANTKIGHVKV